MQDEVRRLRQDVASHNTKVPLMPLAPPVGTFSIACTPSEIAPELAPDAQTASALGGYIAAGGQDGKVHLRHPHRSERTWCGWRWTKTSKAKVHDTAPSGEMCRTCTRRAVAQATCLSESDSD